LIKDKSLSIQNYVLYLTTSLFLVLYIFKQTLTLGTIQTELNITLFLVGSLSIVVNSFMHDIIGSFTRIKKYTLLIYISILIMLLLFENIIKATEFLFKFVYIMHLIYIFIKYKNSKMFIFMADVILILVLFVITLAQLGIMESSEASYNLWEKDFGGFNNPNTVPYFLFSILATYFIFGSLKRYHLALAITLILFLFFNIYSRTFFYGSVLLTILQLLFLNRYFLTLFSKYSRNIYLFISISVVSFLILVLFIPQYLEFLMNSSINNLLSNRLDLILSGLYVVDSNTMSNINFIAFDNIYYELLFIFGPYLFWHYCVNFLKIWEYVAHNRNTNSFLFRLCAVAILMSFLGLFEGGLTKVSPLTMLLFIFIFIDHNNFKDLDFSLKRVTI
jgi:hypothetical protein